MAARGPAMFCVTSEGFRRADTFLSGIGGVGCPEPAQCRSGWARQLMAASVLLRLPQWVLRRCLVGNFPAPSSVGMALGVERPTGLSYWDGLWHKALAPPLCLPQWVLRLPATVGLTA